MKILLCFNPFKGTLSAREATDAVARGLRRAQPRWRLQRLAAADGGPGTLAALRAQAGGRLRHARVSGPLGDPVRAAWLDLGASAVIESAEAIGLQRLPRGRRDALRAQSLGLGQLLNAVARAGKRRVFVGLGGSACTDGGTGAARAAGWRFLDAAGGELPLGGGALAGLAKVLPPARSAWKGLEFKALCDVDAPLFGARGAASTFGPQKGASPAQVKRLDAGLRRLAAKRRPALARRPGAGAAGGLGYGLMAFGGARLLPGARTLLELAGLDALLARCDVVLTGEGSLDAQSLQGKLPAVVAQAGRRAGKPCVALCGRVRLKPSQWRRAGFSEAWAAPGRARELEAAAYRWAVRQK